MVTYKVRVFTSDYIGSATFDHVNIKLMGMDEESKRTYVLGASSYFSRLSKPQVSHSTLTCEASIGKLVLIELEKKQSLSPLQDAWFPAKVEVESPEGKTYIFPIYTWIKDRKVHRFREGTALRVYDDCNLGLYSREQELKQREKEYHWEDTKKKLKEDNKLSLSCKVLSYAMFIKLAVTEIISLFQSKITEPDPRTETSGKDETKTLPDCMKENEAHPLPCEVKFSFTKTIDFYSTAALRYLEPRQKRLLSKLKGILSRLSGWIGLTKNWTSMDQIEKEFGTPGMIEVSKYVHDHWKDDDFFGYQFLNGVNPMMIKRCKALSEIFPFTDDMISLHGGGSLTEEIEKGNIFLCDYKILDGVEANEINGKRQFLTAPLVLLQKTPDDKMMPVAIQLKQKPGEDNPIFFPSDSEHDWLLAKIFVRSADFNVHELNSHLLRTHLLAEVFTVSLLRNVPMVHPLYKLLVPHTRYTLHINSFARQKLISDDGIFTKFTASGGDGMITILSRALSSMTYRSLCIPDDIADRGLQDVPNFYYRDDGLRLWDIIHSFVKGILGHYYKNDDEVVNDTELQKWIKDIFVHGFPSLEKTEDTENTEKKESGIPHEFTTVDELVKFVTMVIFTCSAQHAAVNNGQYDFGRWMPNTPSSLQLPPPTKKGEATEATMLKTLPDVSVTVAGMDTLWLLSSQSSDSVPLGHYPEEHFTEEFPLEKIQDFQKELEELSKSIQERNEKLTPPYKYLDPAQIENSVSI